jgi:ABC-2 type transport system ATP-binding protein
MDAIRTEALTKHYRVGFWRPRPHVALDGLTLDVGRGEVFGFLGPNGAGKTTTLKLLMQLVYPTSGGAHILGRPAGDVEVRRRIGYLPENPCFYDYLTAEELLEYFASLFGYGAAERRRRVAALLDEVGIGAERRFQLRRFSKGMLQRVGIAQAVLNDPEVVFLDEPMSGLDPLGRREIRQMIVRLRDRGSTVFFSSHVLSDAETLCTRVAILARGRLVASGPLSTLLAFQVQGWELVVTGVADDALQYVTRLGQVVRATPFGAGHYALDLPPTASPERVLADLTARGARLVSLTPVRETLEDYFVRQVGNLPLDPGVEAPRSHAGR